MQKEFNKKSMFEKYGRIWPCMLHFLKVECNSFDKCSRDFEVQGAILKRGYPFSYIRQNVHGFGLKSRQFVWGLIPCPDKPSSSCSIYTSPVAS